MISSFIKPTENRAQKKIVFVGDTQYDTSVMRVLRAVLSNPQDIVEIKAGHTKNDTHIMTIVFNSRKNEPSEV